MIIKVTAKRQVTFPARVLEALGVKPGDSLELVERPEGYFLKPRRIDLSRLVPLRGKFPDTIGPFDLAIFREEAHGPSLRD